MEMMVRLHRLPQLQLPAEAEGRTLAALLGPAALEAEVQPEPVCLRIVEASGRLVKAQMEVAQFPVPIDGVLAVVGPLRLAAIQLMQTVPGQAEMASHHPLRVFLYTGQVVALALVTLARQQGGWVEEVIPVPRPQQQVLPILVAAVVLALLLAAQAAPASSSCVMLYDYENLLYMLH
jgi:hypothetical protein